MWKVFMMGSLQARGLQRSVQVPSERSPVKHGESHVR